MFKNYFKTASRNITHYNGYSVINTMGISIGIAVCILLLLWVQDRPNFSQLHNKKDSFYRIVQMDILNKDEQYGHYSISYALAPILEDQCSEIIEYMKMPAALINFDFEDEQSSNTRLLLTKPALFDMFDFAIMRSDKSSPTGKVVNISNRFHFTITENIGNVPHNLSICFDFVAPSRYFATDILRAGYGGHLIMKCV